MKTKAADHKKKRLAVGKMERFRLESQGKLCAWEIYHEIMKRAVLELFESGFKPILENQNRFKTTRLIWKKRAVENELDRSTVQKVSVLKNKNVLVRLLEPQNPSKKKQSSRQRTIVWILPANGTFSFGELSLEDFNLGAP